MPRSPEAQLFKSGFPMLVPNVIYCELLKKREEKHMFSCEQTGLLTFWLSDVCPYSVLDPKGYPSSSRSFGQLRKWLTEKSWRKQVRKKKEEERRRLAKEAAAEARRAEEARALQAKAPVLSPAEQALQEAKRAAEAAKRAAEAEWLENQWQPQLLRRQEEARAQRLEAEAWERQKKRAEEDRQQYEQNGMATEDARGRQHMADLARECERLCERAKTPRVASSIARKIELVLEMRGLEIRWKQNLRPKIHLFSPFLFLLPRWVFPFVAKKVPFHLLKNMLVYFPLFVLKGIDHCWILLL